MGKQKGKRAPATAPEVHTPNAMQGDRDTSTSAIQRARAVPPFGILAVLVRLVDLRC